MTRSVRRGRGFSMVVNVLRTALPARSLLHIEEHLANERLISTTIWVSVCYNGLTISDQNARSDNE